MYFSIADLRKTNKQKSAGAEYHHNKIQSYGESCSHKPSLVERLYDVRLTVKQCRYYISVFPPFISFPCAFWFVCIAPHQLLPALKFQCNLHLCCSVSVGRSQLRYVHLRESEGGCLQHRRAAESNRVGEMSVCGGQREEARERI